MVSVISSNVFVTKLSDVVRCMVPIIANHDQIPLIYGFLCLYRWYVVCGMWYGGSCLPGEIGIFHEICIDNLYNLFN